MLVIGAGTVTVAKDIHTNYPVTANPQFGAPLIARTGTLKAESSLGSEDDFARRDNSGLAKTDNVTDRIFIEDVRPSNLYPQSFEWLSCFSRFELQLRTTTESQ
jgi:hypothetical protein